MSYALKFLPIVAEFASGAGAVATEATGISAIGAAVEGTILAKTGELAEQVLEGTVSTITDTVFGAGSFENFKNHAFETYNDALKIYNFRLTDYSDEDVVKFIKDMNHDHGDISKHVGNFVNDFTKESLTDTPSNVLEKIKKTNPVYYYLASKMLDITAEFVVPSDEEYKKVSSVYDGSVYFENDVFDRDGNFTGINETANPFIWKFPDYNNYAVIPPLYAEFVGLSSPNQKVPLYGVHEGEIKQSQLDKIAFAHDVLYHDHGLFSKFADYVLISYIEAGIREGIFVFPNELETAKIALNYFSTLGRAVRKIYGDDVSEGIIKDLYKDVYDVALTDDHVDTLKDQAIVHIRAGGRLDTAEPSRNGGYKPETLELVSLINNLSFETD